jgi:hypothetical protein
VPREVGEGDGDMAGLVAPGHVGDLPCHGIGRVVLRERRGPTPLLLPLAPPPPS